MSLLSDRATSGQPPSAHCGGGSTAAGRGDGVGDALVVGGVVDVGGLDGAAELDAVAELGSVGGAAEELGAGEVVGPELAAEVGGGEVAAELLRSAASPWPVPATLAEQATPALRRTASAAIAPAVRSGGAMCSLCSSAGASRRAPVARIEYSGSADSATAN